MSYPFCPICGRNTGGARLCSSCSSESEKSGNIEKWISDNFPSLPENYREIGRKKA